MGAQDFAGGIVIHTTAGMSSLVAVWILGHRKGFDKYHGEFPYSNLPLACIGATLLWAGWFGFNGGSALSSGRVAVAAVVNSQVGASAASVVYMLIVLWQTGRPSTIAMINGAIGGLAGVTPAAGYITPPAAMLLGAILGVTVWAGIHLLKHRLRFDDALDVSSVHGLTGIVGALYIGFAGKASVSGANGAVEAHGHRDGWRLLGVQLLAVIVCGAWAAAWTFILLKAIGRFLPLRIPEDEEQNGLDVYLHNEGVEARESFASVANIAAIAAAAGIPAEVALRASMGGVGADYGAINRTSTYHAPPAASVAGSGVRSSMLGRTARSASRFDVAAEDGLRMSEEADMVATLIRAASHQFDSQGSA
jgi:Amt family ammonium transporter